MKIKRLIGALLCVGLIAGGCNSKSEYNFAYMKPDTFNIDKNYKFGPDISVPVSELTGNEKGVQTTLLIDAHIYCIPKSGAAVCGFVNAGNSVMVLSYVSDNWCKISYNGRVAYIVKSVLNIVQEVTTETLPVTPTEPVAPTKPTEPITRPTEPITKPTERTTEESTTEDETPSSEDETPSSEDETPSETETPSEIATPSQIETPSETETQSETETPSESQSEIETPSETESESAADPGFDVVPYEDGEISQ